ncbi:MAG: glycosyltransferase [Chloroflexota bacterium]
MRAIFFPSDLGGGFGHVARCLALAQSWRASGHQAIFALGGKHFRNVQEAGFNAHRLQHTTEPGSGAAAYMLITGLAYQWPRDGYHHSRIVQEAAQEAIDLCKKYQVDVIVSDYWLLARIVAHACRLPLVQIVENFSHPQGTPLVWWEAPPEDVIPPDIRPVANPALKRFGLPPVERAEEMSAGDLLLIPSVPALDPLPEVPANTHYIGSLYQPATGAAPAEKGLVYISIGGGAQQGLRGFFEIALAAFRDAPFHGVLSTGNQVRPSDLRNIPRNLDVKGWVASGQMLKFCELAVFHGGTATRMEVLANGKPALVIPFHSEQENSGRRLEAAGAARVIPYSEAPWEMQKLKWAGAPLTLAYRRQPTLTPEVLRQAIEAMLDDENALQNARRLQQELVTAGGAEKAVRLIVKSVQQFQPPPESAGSGLKKALKQLFGKA